MHMKRLLAMTVAACAGLAAAAPAWGLNGTALAVDPMPRGTALAGTLVAGDASGESFFYNPASCSGVLRTEGRISFDVRNDGLLPFAFTFVLPFKNGLTLAYAQHMLFHPSGATNLPSHLDSENPLDPKLGMASQVLLGGAYSTGKGLALGLALKLIQESADGMQTRVAFDCGAVYALPGLPLRAGVSLQNLYMKLSSRTPDEGVPFRFRGSVAWSPLKGFEHALDIAVAATRAEDRDWRPALGIEYTLADRYLFRLGLEAKDRLPRLGLGYRNVGIDLSLFIDLSVRHTEESGTLLSFSFGIDF